MKFRKLFLFHAVLLGIMIAADISVGQNLPFPQATSPRFGAIRTSLVSQQAANAYVASQYDAWKARYLRSGCGERRRYVYSPAVPGTTANPDTITISEAVGYGLVISVLMAGHDPEARAIFDDLYRFARAFPSLTSERLMAWDITSACTPAKAEFGDVSATDADLDIAMALLLADRQWGSNGEIDYAGEARATLDEIYRLNLAPTDYHVLVGGATIGNAALINGTRLSDQMPSYFRSFSAVTGNSRWSQVLDRSYDIVQLLQASHAPVTGLVPEFADDLHTTPRPASPGFIEGANDSVYGFNSARVPWRLALDFLLNGDIRAKDAVQKMTNWTKRVTNGDPSKIVAPYTLDGRGLNQGAAMAFVAPFLVAATTAAENQDWLNALWRFAAAASIGRDGYYGDTIKIMSLIAATGNWWTVDAPPEKIRPQSGWWYNPAEPGRGYAIEYNPTTKNIFLGTFLYAQADRTSMWYIATCSFSAASCSGPLQQFEGGTTISGAFRPSRLVGSPGNMRLEFDSPQSGRLIWPGGQVPIVRFPFNGSEATTPQVIGAMENGWWYDTSRVGTGWFIESQQGADGTSKMFLTGFMYDNRGQATWYLANGSMNSSFHFQQPLLRYSGGTPIIAAPYQPPGQPVAQGMVTIQFNMSARTATLWLPSGQTSTISRFPF